MSLITGTILFAFFAIFAINVAVLVWCGVSDFIDWMNGDE